MSTEKTRYLVVVPFMDVAELDCDDPVVCPITHAGIVEAASPEIAKEAAFDFAIEMASGFSAWLDEAKGLPFEAGRRLLRDNGLYIGDPDVVPLEKVLIIRSATA